MERRWVESDGPEDQRAELGAAADCLRPDDSTSTDRTTATKSSAGTSPAQVSHVVAAEGLHRHDCGVYDAGPHGEPDQAEIGLRVSRRVEQEDAQCRVYADNHHEVMDW